jgi:A/G-specific adenine glycosylase
MLIDRLLVPYRRGVTGHPDPAAAVPPALRDAVLAWYAATGRELAFRASTNPYAVLVSELMAQQTQAARAAGAWTVWMARFPTVAALAAAPVAEVLRAWAGLGYNRRAVALHRAARIIVAEHGGEVPVSIPELEALPGVGPYTARAVAAIAFGIPVGAVDTNVRRVLGRVAAGGSEAFTPASMQALADAVVPVGFAGVWTHALMDVGARVCRPAKPQCADCPIEAWCRYAAGERPTDESAAAAGARVGDRRPEPRFEMTNRWLRGRILAQARDADDGAWIPYADPIGSHGARAVREAVTTLASEGLLEAREATDGLEARLPR